MNKIKRLIMRKAKIAGFILILILMAVCYVLTGWVSPYALLGCLFGGYVLYSYLSDKETAEVFYNPIIIEDKQQELLEKDKDYVVTPHSSTRNEINF